MSRNTITVLLHHCHKQRSHLRKLHHRGLKPHSFAESTTAIINVGTILSPSDLQGLED
jgi:hypothetical protein